MKVLERHSLTTCHWRRLLKLDAVAVVVVAVGTAAEAVARIAAVGTWCIEDLLSNLSMKEVQPNGRLLD